VRKTVLATEAQRAQRKDLKLPTSAFARLRLDKGLTGFTRWELRGNSLL
jgi:hypothetical protein